MSGRKFYNENKEKCLEYTRRRRERAREARKKELEERLARGEVIEQPRKKSVLLMKVPEKGLQMKKLKKKLRPGRKLIVCAESKRIWHGRGAHKLILQRKINPRNVNK